MELIQATSKDVKKLQNICIEAYSQSFKDHWIKNGLDLYLKNQFSEIKLTSDINNPNIDYFFIALDDVNIGFLKLKIFADVSVEDDCELEKIYILPKYKGLGFGTFALKHIIDGMKTLGKKNLVLDVIDSNTSGISFYKSLGFKKVATTTLDEPFFKEELKGMYIMKLELV